MLCNAFLFFFLSLNKSYSCLYYCLIYVIIHRGDGCKSPAPHLDWMIKCLHLLHNVPKFLLERQRVGESLWKSRVGGGEFPVCCLQYVVYLVVVSFLISTQRGRRLVAADLISCL